MRRRRSRSLSRSGGLRVNLGPRVCRPRAVRTGLRDRRASPLQQVVQARCRSNSRREWCEGDAYVGAAPVRDCRVYWWCSRHLLRSGHLPGRRAGGFVGLRPPSGGRAVRIAEPRRRERRRLWGAPAVAAAGAPPSSVVKQRRVAARVRNRLATIKNPGCSGTRAARRYGLAARSTGHDSSSLTISVRGQPRQL